MDGGDSWLISTVTYPAVAVSVKTVSILAVYAVAAGACARQARVFRAKEWAELHARRNGRYGKIELDPI